MLCGSPSETSGFRPAELPALGLARPRPTFPCPPGGVSSEGQLQRLGSQRDERWAQDALWTDLPLADGRRPHPIRSDRPLRPCARSHRPEAPFEPEGGVSRVFVGTGVGSERRGKLSCGGRGRRVGPLTDGTPKLARETPGGVFEVLTSVPSRLERSPPKRSRTPVDLLNPNFDNPTTLRQRANRFVEARVGGSGSSPASQ